MILDSLETKMQIAVPDGCAVLDRYSVDAEGLERGERYLTIPDGITKIESGAFAEYNDSPVIENVRYILRKPEDQIAEWSKKLIGKRLLKITFPPEAGKTVRERAGYLVEKEKRVRLLRLSLPETLTEIGAASFPVLLEHISVAGGSRSFMSRDGVLYTRDGKTLIRYPGYQGDGSFRVPVGVEELVSGAFSGAFLTRLLIPASVKRIGAGCFQGAVIGELSFEEGFEGITEQAFEQCAVERICLPSSLRYIGNYAFQQTTGLREIHCESDDLSIGVGVFRGGSYNNVNWWLWSEIPKATFLNCHLAKIDVPSGVEVIGDYAFAGCCRARHISIPASVREIGPRSFDEGETFAADITVPEHLYRFIYRLPPLSTINGSGKSVLWEKHPGVPFEEEKNILERQKTVLENGLRKASLWNVVYRRRLNRELAYLGRLLTATA